LTFRTSRRLNFGDCDPSGIAYFPSYLHILVGVLEEFFQELGAGWPGMIAERRIGVPTVRLDLTFKKPGFHGNTLNFEVFVAGVGTTSLDLEHAVSCDGQVLWTAIHRVVATSLESHKACPWPDDIKAALIYSLEKTNAHGPAA
jgi:4-hydroxybenzoyl-CoA thioesterase